MADDPNTQPVVPPVAPPAGNVEPPDVTPDAGKTIMLKSSQLGRIKKEQREKGKKDALTEYAKSQGFASVDEMNAAVARGKSAPSSAPAQAQAALAPGQRKDPGPAPSGMNPRAAAGWEKEREKIQQENSRLKQTVATQDRSLRRAKQREQDLETQMALRESAAKLGVKDVDYAIRLLERKVDSMTPEEQAKFDDEKFFGGLRETNPYLFGEVVKPANTGTAGNGTAPTPPGAGAAAAAQARNGSAAKNVSQMNEQEFAEYKRKRHLITS